MTDEEIRAQVLFEGSDQRTFHVSFRGQQFATVRVDDVSDLLVTDLATGRSTRLTMAEELAETLVSLVRIHLLQ